MVRIQRRLLAIRQNPATRGSAVRSVIPAPVLGLNSLDPEAAMEELYATEMVNFFPDHGRLVTRRGSAEWVDIPGEAGAIGTLHSWVNGSSSKLFAFSPTKVWDVSARANAVAAVERGVTSNRWSGANMNGHAIFCNGHDTPLRVDGDGNFVAHGFTGATDHPLVPENLRSVQVHRGRLYFTERDSSKFWYGDADSVTGELTSFDLGGVTPEGGSILAIGSLSVDTGEGANDLIVFLMERGQVILYSGGDPEGQDWRLNGVFQLAPVIGRDPMVKLGADLIIITEDGYLPLIQFLQGGRQQQRLALSNKITPTVKDAVQLYGAADGWQAVYYGSANWLLFNVGGRGGGAGVQHVMNTNSGAWTEFRGMPAECWEEHDKLLFYGAPDGIVAQADIGGTDIGDESINYAAQSAYSYLGTPYDKHIRAVRPHFIASGATVDVRFGVAMDFALVAPELRSFRVQDDGEPWNADGNGPVTWANWKWGSGDIAFREYRLRTDRGTAAASRLELSLSAGEVSWFSTDISYSHLRGSLVQFG